MTKSLLLEGRDGLACLFAPRVNHAGQLVASPPITAAAGSIDACGNHRPVHGRRGVGRQDRPEQGLSHWSDRVLEPARYFTDQSWRGPTYPRFDLALQVDDPVHLIRRLAAAFEHLLVPPAPDLNAPVSKLMLQLPQVDLGCFGLTIRPQLRGGCAQLLPEPRPYLALARQLHCAVVVQPQGLIESGQQRIELPPLIEPRCSRQRHVEPDDGVHVTLDGLVKRFRKPMCAAVRGRPPRRGDVPPVQDMRQMAVIGETAPADDIARRLHRVVSRQISLNDRDQKFEDRQALPVVATEGSIDAVG